jgi:hypothetical protein
LASIALDHKNQGVNVLRASDGIASVISFGVLLVTIWQLNQANEATSKAETALNRVAAAVTRITEVAADMVNFAEAVTGSSAIKAELFMFTMPKQRREKLEMELKKYEDVMRQNRMKYQKQ